MFECRKKQEESVVCGRQVGVVLSARDQNAPSERSHTGNVARIVPAIALDTLRLLDERRKGKTIIARSPILETGRQLSDAAAEL